VTKESEEVLVKDRIPSPSRIKEGGIEVTIRKEYCNSSSKDRKGEKE